MCAKSNQTNKDEAESRESEIKIPFEQSLAKLEEIVESLSGGKLSLEQSLALYKEGRRLVIYCQNKLKEVEQEILLLTPDENGAPRKKPLNKANQSDEL